MMTRYSRPIGMIRHEELLNALVALWKSRCCSFSSSSDAANQIYEQGFEEGLDAVAQIAGLDELFDAIKTDYRRRRRPQPTVTVIQSQPQLLNGESHS